MRLRSHNCKALNKFPCERFQRCRYPKGCREVKGVQYRGREAQNALRCRGVTAEAEEQCKQSSDSSTSQAHLVSIEDRAYTVEGAITTEASFGKVWEVLTDYSNLERVFSNIKESNVETHSTEIRLQQQCKWEFLIFSGSFSAGLTVKEEKSKGRLTFNLVQSSFMDEFVGRWKISEQNSGGCIVEHRLRVIPKLSPPAFMSDYTQRVFVKQVSRILKDLDEELQLRDDDDF